ncbi:UDP-N-acetylmuramate dehydrogenase [Pelagibacteraceae bacterium]|nr:UDP-N-acetylmuramate dehydrogenase [Pelagibacteraceae bacterium]
MKLISKETELKLGKKILLNEKLANYSWFNLGGSSEIFFKPDSEEDIIFFFKKTKPKQVNILGAGSNTLIRDGGVKGVTIKLSPKFSYLNFISPNIIEAGAATLDRKIADFALEHSLTGLEFLSCIPGSIGGAIRMNSGCYNEDISRILHSIQVIDVFGNKRDILASNIKFNYRECSLGNNLIITSVKIIGEPSLKEKIQKKQINLVAKKKDAQPNQIKTCGSTFKNTKNKKAWELIKESNCHNLQVGNAKISNKHCNFFVNEGGATAKDLEDLINKVRETVYQKTKIKLELEIKIIGHDK